MVLAAIGGFVLGVLVGLIGVLLWAVTTLDQAWEGESWTPD